MEFPALSIGENSAVDADLWRTIPPRQLDEIASLRDQGRGERDDVAEQQDHAADRRDLAADLRDRTAETRDQAAATIGLTGIGALDRFLREIASDRAHSTHDRAAAADERPRPGGSRSGCEGSRPLGRSGPPWQCLDDHRKRVPLRAIAGDPRYSNRRLLSGNEPCTGSDLPITIRFHRNGEWWSQSRSRIPANLKALGVTVDRRLRDGLLIPSAASEVFTSTREGRTSLRRRIRHRPHSFARVGAIVAIADSLGFAATDEGERTRTNMSISTGSGADRDKRFCLACSIEPTCTQFVTKSGPLAGRLIR